MVFRKAPHTWLYEDPELEPWIRALQDIDKRGDKTTLVELLKSGTPPPFKARWHLADLLDRYQLKPKHGGKAGGRTPSYDVTQRVAQLDAAVVGVRSLMKEGMPRDEAVKKIAPYRGVSEEALQLHLDGKYASARRQKKRLPPGGL